MGGLLGRAVGGMLRSAVGAMGEQLRQAAEQVADVQVGACGLGALGLGHCLACKLREWRRPRAHKSESACGLVGFHHARRVQCSTPHLLHLAPRRSAPPV